MSKAEKLGLTKLTRTDQESHLAFIWDALHDYRENCIPENENDFYDRYWSDICTAMAWIREDLGLCSEIERERQTYTRLSPALEERIQNEVIHRLDIQTESDWFREFVKNLVIESLQLIQIEQKANDE